MKKLLFSAAVIMGAMGIAVASSNSTKATLPADNKAYIVRDTTPTDTTKPVDSSFLLLKK